MVLGGGRFLRSEVSLYLQRQEPPPRKQLPGQALEEHPPPLPRPLPDGPHGPHQLLPVPHQLFPVSVFWLWPSVSAAPVPLGAPALFDQAR